MKTFVSRCFLICFNKTCSVLVQILGILQGLETGKLGQYGTWYDIFRDNIDNSEIILKNWFIMGSILTIFGNTDPALPIFSLVVNAFYRLTNKRQYHNNKGSQ